MLKTDLNLDGKVDWLVHITRQENCGTGGCTLLVIRQTPTGWQQIGRMPTARAPIGTLSSQTNGHFDIFVGVGGGGTLLGTARVPFVNGQYGPSTTSAPAEIIHRSGE